MMTIANRQVVRGGRILDIAGHGAEPRDILIEGDEIAALLAPGAAVPAGTTVVDAANRLLHPGLVNSHTHGHGGLARGMGDRWTLELLLAASPWITGNRTLADKYLSTKLGAVEMVLKGCTACYDLTVDFPVPTVDGLDAAARAYGDVGMRAVLAPMVADHSFFDAIPGLLDALPETLRRRAAAFAMAPREASMENMRTVFRNGAPSDLVRFAVAPTIPLHCSDELILGCAELAREFGIGLHSHVAESKIQAVSGIDTYGKTLTAHLDALGVLGPHFTVAHGVWLDHDDMRRLGDHGASVAHNPGSNMRLGSGLADMRAMLDRKVNVGLGTDGVQCSDNLNMFEAMRLASMVSHVRTADQETWLTTAEAAQAATVGSARALGLGDRIGRLAPGFKADIVFLDLGHINWLPLNDATNQLVHCEDGNAVDSVMIGGRMIVEHRSVATVDMSGLQREAEAARERLARLNVEAKALFEQLAAFVGSFCPGLAARPYRVDRYGARGEG
jgi:5-methylthioadenosine/S-adenosylhomocysteine deaminase